MINKQHLLTYIYLLLYTTLSSGVILYNKARHISVYFVTEMHYSYFFFLHNAFCLSVSVSSFTTYSVAVCCWKAKKKESILIFPLYWRMVLLGFLFFAVVPVHTLLQLSISNYTHHDSHGLFWCGGIFSYSYCEGMILLKLVLPFLFILLYLIPYFFLRFSGIATIRQFFSFSLIQVVLSKVMLDSGKHVGTETRMW